MIQIVLISFMVASLVTIIIGMPLIKWLRKLKFGQSILEYVDFHSRKQGTPTMGGLIFFVGMLIGSIFLFDQDNYLAIFTLIVTFAFGFIGFLDDFIKVKFKQNLGLRAYQKIIGQGGLALIVAFISYYSSLIPNGFYIPFTLTFIDIGWWIIPLIFLVFIALTNAVNLTDGLDGLASGVSFSYLLAFIGIGFILLNQINYAGGSQSEINQLLNLIIIAGALAGGLLGFLTYNSHPAKVFMGDVGSLSIGACLACLAVFSGLTLYIPILGIMFVMSALSDIIQVVYYKKTKKRVFLMAPLHHHFEKKGVHETKIVVIYIIITILIGVLSILFTLL